MIYTAAKILVLIEEAGFDDRAVRDLLATASLCKADLLKADATFSFQQVMTIFRTIIENTSDKGLAFRAGRRFRLTHLGILGFALMSQPDLRSALRFTTKYRPLSSPMIGLDIVSDETSCRLVFTPFAGFSADDPIYPRVLDFNFGLFMALIEDGLGRGDVFSCLHLSGHADAVTINTLQDHGFCVETDSSEDSIELAASTLDAPLRQNSLVGAAVARKLCDEAMVVSPNLPQFANEVRACLIANVEKPVTAAYVARIMGLSERSFRRQLSAEGLGFRDLKQDVQVALARQYLEQTQMTVKDIALATGFSNAANFRRSFRRFQGVSPSEFKRHPR